LKKKQKEKILRKIKLYTILVLELFILSLLLLKLDKQNVELVEASSQVVTEVPVKKPNYEYPILIYHYVEYVTDDRDTIRKSLNTPPHVLKSQIKTLKDAGYIFITPAEIQKIASGRLQISGKPIILSFDDGYEDFYTDVFPILKENQIKAVAYIVPGFLDHLNSMHTWQLEEVGKSQIVEIGAHTLHHAHLSQMAETAAKYEIEESKKELEEELQTEIVSFAYPYGAYSMQIIDLVKSAGFTNAGSTEEGTNENLSELYHLNRFHPGHRVGKELISLIEKN
jgi:peptidoglycan/xylan/chitin deacetylase (PgdA/CDA1 family)